MFINNVHILLYIVIGILGLFVGNFLEYINIKLPKHEKIFSINSMKLYFKQRKTNYLLMFIMSTLYVALLRNNRNRRHNKIVTILSINTIISIIFYNRLQITNNT